MKEHKCGISAVQYLKKVKVREHGRGKSILQYPRVNKLSEYRCGTQMCTARYHPQKKWRKNK